MSIVLFGISGSIAAFKALEVIRLLVVDGVEVVPILSEGGAKFVTRNSVEAITRRRAVTEIFPEPARQEIEHIALAQKADLLITCPASADIIAKYAAGIADDPLALIALAFGSPHIIAPAMNYRMWEHPATKANVATLSQRGCVFIGPDKGMMACDEEGWGRLASVDEIYGHICAQLGVNGPLAGKSILVSAGATREFIDDVRYLTNRSTGRMGHAIAAAARDLGAMVDLVTASDLEPPSALNNVSVISAEEMHEVILEKADSADVIIMNAAVADFAPEGKIEGKIKKKSKSGSMDLQLRSTPDILRALGDRKREGQVLIGFAAEHGADGRDEALRKCREKSCDLVCLNDISQADGGFASDYNEVVLVFPDGSERSIPRGTKKDVARVVMMEVAGMIG